jgi:mono/diheme cytochrome c family protein
MLAGVAFLCLAAPVTAQSAATTTAASGGNSFTDAQAVQGEIVYKRACSACHQIRDHSNEDFRFNWKGRSVLELFNTIRNSMPEETPGSLAPQEYADIVAYMMKVNGIAAGPRPLLPDTVALRATRFDVKDARQK